MALSGTVQAQEMTHDPMMHQIHMAEMGADTRQPVQFPPEMRQHTLANMRDHLQALSDILSALSESNYAKADEIASLRLGMDSPAAAGCKVDSPSAMPQMSPAMNMDHHMAALMPEGMRNIGLRMHQSASAFASVANRASLRRTGDVNDAKLAQAALAKVTQQCTSCHAAYKLQ